MPERYCEQGLRVDGDLQVLKLWSRARRRLELTLQQEELLLAHHFRPKMPTLRILGVLGGSSFLPQRKEAIWRKLFSY